MGKLTIILLVLLVLLGLSIPFICQSKIKEGVNEIVKCSEHYKSYIPQSLVVDWCSSRVVYYPNSPYADQK